MPDGSTGAKAPRIRIPAKIRTISQLLDTFRVQRDIAADWQKTNRDEAREFDAVKKRERRIKEKYAKRRHRLLPRRNRIANKEFEFATQHRSEITEEGSPNTARFSLGRLIWRARKVTDLPENDKLPEDEARLEAFYAELTKRGLVSKYARVKMEPNRLALTDAENEAEVGTLESVSIVERTRFTIELKDMKLNVVGTIGADDKVSEWEYVKPESRSENK